MNIASQEELESYWPCAPQPRTKSINTGDCSGSGEWAWESYGGELKVVQAVVSQDEPASLPRLNPASCKYRETHAN